MHLNVHTDESQGFSRQALPYNDHARSNCTTHSHQVSSSTSVVDVLSQPLTSPLTAVEQKLQTSLARRSLSNSPDEVLQMKTGGRVSKTYTLRTHTYCNKHTWSQPMTFVWVSQSQVPTGQAAAIRTIWKRSHSLASV